MNRLNKYHAWFMKLDKVIKVSKIIIKKFLIANKNIETNKKEFIKLQ